MDEEREPARGRSRAARGSARDRLRVAGAQLFGRATLDDLSAFATVGRLTAESGLSSGAIYSAFPTDPDVARSAPQAAMRDAYLCIDFADDRIVREVMEVFERAVASPEGATRVLETLTKVIATLVADGVRDPARWEYTHLWLGATAANNDPEVARMLEAYYVGLDDSYELLIEAVLKYTGRVPVSGVRARDIARVLIASVDGAAMRFRIDPDVDVTMLSSTMLGVVASMTRRVDEADDVFARRLTSASDDPLGAADLDAIAAAVRRVEQRAGWQEVDLGRIAALSGVDEVDLVAVYPTRHHLAAIIWSDVLDRLERRTTARTDQDRRSRLAELVMDLAEAACGRRAVIASLLTARLHRSSVVGPDSDPVNVRAVAMITALLPGGVEITEVAARTALDALLLGAAGSTATADELGTVLVSGLVALSDWVGSGGGRASDDGAAADDAAASMVSRVSLGEATT